MADNRNKKAYSRNQTAPSRKRQGGGSMGPFLLLGLLLLIILGVIYGIVSSGRKKQAAIKSSEAESASIAASIAQSEAEEAAQKIELREFSPTEIPELNTLVKDYFDARLAGDSSRILAMYGRSDTTPDTALEQKLKAQAAWIQTFRNINVWDVPGVHEGDRLCLVQYDVDFRRTDTLAPGIMYFYAERTADGSYRFVENLLKDRVDFMDQELEGEQASDMIADTDARLKEALDTDSELALIYTSFQNGEIYRESNLDMDREQQVDLFLDPADSILVEGVEIPNAPQSEEVQAEAEAGDDSDVSVEEGGAEETAAPVPEAAEEGPQSEETQETEAAE